MARRDTAVTAAIVACVLAVVLGQVLLFGLSDGQGDIPSRAPCEIDTRTLRTAQEAFRNDPAKGNGKYTSSDRLVEFGLLSEPSVLHAIALGPEARSFTILVVDPMCGTQGHFVGQTAKDR